MATTLPAPARRSPIGPAPAGTIAAMTTLARLGADDLRAVVVAYRDALRAHQEPINRLNVYPVPGQGRHGGDGTGRSRSDRATTGRRW